MTWYYIDMNTTPNTQEAGTMETITVNRTTYKVLDRTTAQDAELKGKGALAKMLREEKRTLVFIRRPRGQVVFFVNEMLRNGRTIYSNPVKVG